MVIAILASKVQESVYVPLDDRPKGEDVSAWTSAWDLCRGGAPCRKEVKVALSVCIYCLSVSAIPIYNKEVFSGGSRFQEFPYPIATAFLQLTCVSLALAAATVAAHLASAKAGEDRSWIFGPHLGYKLRHVGPTGLVFGLKFAVTNWGLQLVPTGTHLVMQSTDLLCTAVLAYFVNGERLGRRESAAVVLSTLGTMLVGISASQTLSAPLVPMLVNTLTPLCGACSITTLRKAVKELTRSSNCLRGTMPVSEIACLKLGVSALTALVASLILEGTVLQLSKHSGVAAARRPAWWQALAAFPPEGVLLILGGSAFILIFQVNMTWLSKLTSATTVGMCGSLKVIPQWLLNAAFNMTVTLTPLNVAGSVLVLASSGVYFLASSKTDRLSPKPTQAAFLRTEIASPLER